MSARIGQRSSKREPVHRGRVQQQLVQQPEGSLPSGDRSGLLGGQPDLRGVALLTAFVQSLLTTVSGDQILLALSSAARAMGVPKEEAEKVLKILLSYNKRNSMFPPGFMD